MEGPHQPPGPHRPLDGTPLQPPTNITRPPLLQLGFDASWGDNLDTGRADRYCTGRKSNGCRALMWAFHMLCMEVRVPPLPPELQAIPTTTELPWPVVLSTRPRQPVWAPMTDLSIPDVASANSSRPPTARQDPPCCHHCMCSTMATRP